jgi:hypothetical protein
MLFLSVTPLYYPILDTIIEPLKDLYLITTLNPQFKLDIFKSLTYNRSTIEEIRNYFLEVYNTYKENSTIVPTNTIYNPTDLDIDSNNSSNNELYITNNTRFTDLDIENKIELYLREP